MPAEQAVLPQVGLPVLFEGLSATTQYFEQTYNRGKSILEDTLTAFKQDKEAGPSRLKQSERLMHQFRAEKDKAAAFAWAEVANAKRFANDPVCCRDKVRTALDYQPPALQSGFNPRNSASGL